MNGLIESLSRDRLESQNEQSRTKELELASKKLSVFLRESNDFHATSFELVAEFERLGHDLRLFDADFDLDADDESSYLWCGDWDRPDSTPLIITTHSKRGVKLEWTNVAGNH